MIHEIRCFADDFHSITSGRRSFVCQRKTDAIYQEGDFLALNEYVMDGGMDTLTGRCCLVKVVDIYTGPAAYMTIGTIVMSVRPCAISVADTTHAYNRDLYAVDIYGGDKEGARA